MREIDYNNHVAVTREIFWVGYLDAQADLHCNPYLLIDDTEVVIFDPGSIPHFPIVMRKVIDLVNPADISLIIASHQDPDVCGNLAVIEDVINRPDLRVAGHSRTIRLIRHYGIRSDFYPVNKHDDSISLKSGRVLDFIAIPYLHAPGAIMTYDRQSRTLFSGDLFGGVDVNWTLFAGDDYFPQMDAFHQRYMPSNRILKPCMEKLATMNIERIVPQHGSILEGAQVAAAIAHLKELPCGIDLIKGLSDA